VFISITDNKENLDAVANLPLESDDPEINKQLADLADNMTVQNSMEAIKKQLEAATKEIEARVADIPKEFRPEQSDTAKEGMKKIVEMYGDAPEPVYEQLQKEDAELKVFP
jgi:hypothetical protein